MKQEGALTDRDRLAGGLTVIGAHDRREVLSVLPVKPSTPMDTSDAIPQELPSVPCLPRYSLLG